MLRLIACLVGAAALAGCGVAAATPDPEKDKAATEAALRQWPEDRNSGEFCERMQTLFNDPDKRYSYAQPDGTWKIHVSHAFTK
jgi:hypothetical protein